MSFPQYSALLFTEDKCFVHIQVWVLPSLPPYSRFVLCIMAEELFLRPSDLLCDLREECQRRKIRLFVLPPNSLKLNGCVERAHRTHTEEFCEVYECSWNVTELNPELRHWEYVYDCARSHQALNYKTPLQFLRDSGIVDSSYPSNPSHMW
jgi:hypothetical protein